MLFFFFKPQMERTCGDEIWVTELIERVESLVKSLESMLTVLIALAFNLYFGCFNS